MNPVNPRVNDDFCRELIRLSVIPDRLGCVRFTHWNRPAAQLDNEHRPLVLVQATGLRDFIVREMTDGKAVASDGSGGKRECLPGMSHTCKQYRYARSRYFHASRHAMLVKTNITGTELSVHFISRSPRARCSAMCAEGR